MARRIHTAPEWLDKRHDENPDKWKGSSVAPLIASTLGDARRGIVQATSDPSEIGELLRTYALVQARYGLTTLSVAEHHHDSETCAIAHQYWLQELTNRVLNKKPNDWNDGTGSAIARSIGTIDDDIEAFDSALPHLMTGNMSAITRALNTKTPNAVKALRALRRKLAHHLQNSPSPSTHKDWGGGETRRDDYEIEAIASMIDEARERLDKKARQGRVARALSGQPGQGKNTQADKRRARWHDVKPSPNKLTRPHVGKIGAKRSPSDTGRTIKHPSRALTDPARRVFERRARSKNALVVLDMSGSMNYRTEQLDEVLELARGAVVVGYSISSDDYNFHLLARDGMRVADLPDHGGANGLDGTALTYAVNKYRKNSTTPIVWVSDGEVNGIGDHTELALDMIHRLRATGAHHVENLTEAIELLENMARGHKPAPRIGDRLIEIAKRSERGY